MTHGKLNSESNWTAWALLVKAAAIRAAIIVLVDFMSDVVFLFFNYKSCSGRALLNGSDVTFCPFFILIYMKTAVESN